MAAAAAQGKWLCDMGSSALLQRTLAQLMATGEYDRHIRRMQKRYRERRQALLAALKRHLGAKAQVEGAPLGSIRGLAPRLPRDSVDALVDACAARGVGVYSMAHHAKRPLPRAGLLLGYGLTDAAQIQRGVKALSDAYREVARNEPRGTAL